jgi:hypothetical protein
MKANFTKALWHGPLGHDITRAGCPCHSWLMLLALILAAGLASSCRQPRSVSENYGFFLNLHL